MVVAGWEAVNDENLEGWNGTNPDLDMIFPS
jgi:hypothetical protein